VIQKKVKKWVQTEGVEVKWIAVEAVGVAEVEAVKTGELS